MWIDSDGVSMAYENVCEMSFAASLKLNSLTKQPMSQSTQEYSLSTRAPVYVEMTVPVSLHKVDVTPVHWAPSGQNRRLTSTSPVGQDSEG